MKNWKLNGILLLLFLGICFCSKKIEIFSTDNTNKLERLNKNIENSIYTANDKLLNKLEKKNSELINDQKEKQKHNNFIQKTSDSKIEEVAPINAGNTKLNRGENKKIKFVHLTNLKIPNDKPDLIKYKECSYKTGLIEIVKKQNSDTVELERVRIELDLNNLKLFTSLTNLSLFYKIELDKILKIYQKKIFFNTFCFDIIRNDIKKPNLLVGSVTLCAKDKVDMDEWIKAIQKFKNCNVNTNNKSAEVIVDFNKINKLNNGSNMLKDLFYDNTKSVFNKGKLNNANKIIINKAVNTLLERLKENSIKENQLKRTLDDKYKQAQMVTKNVEKKKELLEKMIKMKVEKQKKMDLKLKSSDKELQLIKSVTDKLEALRKNQFKGMKVKRENLIQEEKRKAKEKSDMLMNKLINVNKNLDYQRCTDKRLKDFKNTQYIETTCLQIYGKHGDKQCEKKKTFCNLCCRHHVGENYLIKRQQCIKSCTLIINESANKYKAEYSF